MSWLFASGGQSVRTSASASVLPMKIQGCFPLAFTGLISFRSKRLSRVFSIPGRQRLWKPPGSCFRPCGPRASEREGPGREPVPCRPALLVQLACPPHPHHGLLSRQMRHFINCVLNTCFKLVKKKKKSLLQHHNSKASILQCSAFFVIQFSHLYMTTRKTIALTIWTFVGKMLSLLYNMLSMFVMKNSHAKHLSQRGIKDTI